MGTPIAFGTNNDQNIIVQLTLDKAGRVLARRDPRGNRTTFTYDALNRRTSLTNPLSQTWQTSYSVANGVLTTTLTDPLGHTTQQVADRSGRLRYLRHQAESPKQTPDLTFSYDKHGNRLVMAESTGGVSPSRVTRYSYSGTRRLKQVGFDLNGNGSIIQLVNYGYDPAGRRKTLVLPSGQTVSYGYDPKGRLSTLIDWSSQTTTYSYDGADRPATVARANGLSSAYAYDAAGRLLNLSHLAAGGNTLGSFAYTVDARGNRTAVTEQLGSVSLPPSDSAVNYYLGSWVNDGHGLYASTDLPAAFKLAVYSSQIALTMGTGPDHGLYDVYLDGDLWNTLDGYAATFGTQTVTLTAATLGWHTLDVRNRPDHNLASSGYKIRFGGLSTSGRSVQYQYDALSRLIDAQVFPSPTSPARNLHDQYQYDVAGNRTQQIVTDASAVTTNYSYDAANRLTSDGTHSYSYDATGNLTSDGVNTYTWDRANRMIGYVGGGYSYTYSYDGDGRRVQQTVDSAVTQYLLDVQPSLAPVLQATTSGNTISYVPGPTGVRQQQNPAGNWNWTMPDGLGSVRGVTDNSANVLETRFYSPFGQETQQMGSVQTVFGFTGEETDGNGLVNLRARYYNPAIGQFFSLDPLEGDAGQPMSLNRYAYVQDNPVNLVDPSGMKPPQLCGSVFNGTGNGPWFGTGGGPGGGPGSGNCTTISPLSNDGQQVDANRIDTSLLESWGVVLTVKCEIPNNPSDPLNVDWKNPMLPQQKQHLTDAFTVIDNRLKQATDGQYGFISVFGGLEIRHVFDKQVGDYGNAITPQPQGGYLMMWGDRGRKYALNVANPNVNTQDNIIHEFGHVLDYRSGHMVATSAPTSLYTTFNALNLVAPEYYGGLRHQRGVDLPGEYVADHFLNWARISYGVTADPHTINGSLTSGVYDPNEPSRNVRIVTAFWLGGDFRNNPNSLQEPSISSPGMLFWAAGAFLKAFQGLLSFQKFS